MTGASADKPQEEDVCPHIPGALTILSSANDGNVTYLCTVQGALLWMHPDADPAHVVGFDVAEFATHYGYDTTQLPLAIDILDIGYYLNDGSYEPPEPDYRHARSGCVA